jgi:hypothetical protein
MIQAIHALLAKHPHSTNHRQCIMKERPNFKGLNVGMAPPPLRYAVQGLRSAAEAQGERCVRRKKLAGSRQNG